MNSAGNLKLTTPTDREIVITRVFKVPRRLIFEAFTQPNLLKRWLLGPPGWSMVVCDMDLRVGGAYRWVWRHDANGHEMGMGGVYREIVAPELIVCTEKFDQPWYPGEAVGLMVLTEQTGYTTLTQTIRYESREIRDGVLKTPMEQGVAASYNQLESLLASEPDENRQAS